MAEYTLMEKLQQLADWKFGDSCPEFIKGSFNSWGDDLALLAKDAIEEINRGTTARILMSSFTALPQMPDVRDRIVMDDPQAHLIEPQSVNFDRIWSKSMARY